MIEKTRRPDILTILCILTFVGSGSSLIANSFLYLMFDQVKEIVGQQEALSFLGSEINLSFLLEIKPVFFLIQAALYFLSVFGAYQMFQLRKIGFHLYTVSQILLLIMSKIFIPSLPFPIFELMVSTVFIFLYYKNLQFMS